MLEIIQIICSIALIIITPIETGKVVKGWVRPRFKGDPSTFRASFRKQLTVFIWLGAVFFVLQLLLGFMDPGDGTNLVVKVVIGLLWAGVGITGFVSRRRIDQAPAT
ncbi:hypothetical protein D3874_10275 [Oleomonas cavernae]|uniref:Uncharacterized protein n=1 Tax=Oleomonas cavernae TaxID=2320859 RepID=A0A418WBH2_9PROT|nr:hypothetical protein [Oleomonas cavernae]RJF87362.1 hypothetical protein D3874_10275 [Oleomonas cavernae]